MKQFRCHGRSNPGIGWKTSSVDGGVVSVRDVVNVSDVDGVVVVDIDKVLTMTIELRRIHGCRLERDDIIQMSSDVNGGVDD